MSRRIVFMGTPQYAVASLHALVEAGYEVAGVFTQPDKPKGRGGKVQAPPVKEYALEHGIPVFAPRRIRDEGVGTLRELAPDLCVTAAFGQILSQQLLDIPRLGTINVHASLLPRYRGSAPVAWSIIKGETTTGVTTMMTDKGIDTGDILMQAALAIRPGETAGELTQRLATLGAGLLLQTTAAVFAGTCPRKPQDNNQMSYYPMLTKEMGLLDWAQDAQTLVNLVRGLHPWPGAYTMTAQGPLKLLQATAVDGEGQHGEVLLADGKAGLVVACGRGALKVLQLQAQGGKPMAAQDYLRGHPIAPGSRFDAGEGLGEEQTR